MQNVIMANRHFQEVQHLHKQLSESKFLMQNSLNLMTVLI